METTIIFRSMMIFRGWPCTPYMLLPLPESTLIGVLTGKKESDSPNSGYLPLAMAVCFAVNPSKGASTLASSQEHPRELLVPKKCTGG